MTGTVHPLRPHHAAEPGVTDKREATAKARAALLGTTLRRPVRDDGAVVFMLGPHALESLDAVEDVLDRIDGGTA
jgi:hypothetical protein